MAIKIKNWLRVPCEDCGHDAEIFVYIKELGRMYFCEECYEKHDYEDENEDIRDTQI